MWNALFLYAGYRLGVQWRDVGQSLQPVSYAVAGGAVLLALIALTVRTLRRRRVTS